MPTTWTGEAALVGNGNMAALGIKPPNRIVARFAGSSALNVITIAPRLVASAHFVGDGQLFQKANSAVNILSTAASVRYSFPTVASPTDPFIRRPSKGYNNYNISVRFTGSGRLRALAS